MAAMKAAEERATTEPAKLAAGVAEAATALATLEVTVGTLQQAHEEIEARINAALRDIIEDHCRRSFTIAGEPEAAARESGEVLWATVQQALLGQLQLTHVSIISAYRVGKFKKGKLPLIRAASSSLSAAWRKLRSWSGNGAR